MGLRTSIIILSFAPLFMAGCGKSNYFLKSQTPEDLDGFLGFRWTTPMDIVDEQLMGTTDAEQAPASGDFYTLAYQNIYFMKRESRLCQFTFDAKGLSAAKLTFKTSGPYSESDLSYFRNELTMIYGLPIQMTRPAYKEEYKNYIDGYYWINGRLAITLMPGNRIIINAFRDKCEPPDAPPRSPMNRANIDKVSEWISN